MNPVLEVKQFEELTVYRLHEILKARQKVFMLEQQIRCLDPDFSDYSSLHLSLLDAGELVAYLRAYPSEEEKNTLRIGRVLTLKRGIGLGRCLMEQSLSVLDRCYPGWCITLDAQEHAVGFYEKFGFFVSSDMFMEEGIPHYRMKRI